MQSKHSMEIYRFYGLVSFFLSMVTVILAFFCAGILPGGGKCKLITDTMDQMTPLVVMFTRHLRESDSLFYSLETALGQNTALLNAFCVYSPINLLFFLISDPYVATLACLTLKVGLSALFFHLFLQFGMGYDAKKAVFFSLCYALNAYQCDYMLSMNLMDAVYLLPLLMLILKKAIDTEKCTLLGFAYAMCFMINFYDGFLLGLFSFAVLLVTFFMKEGTGFLHKRKHFLIQYVFCVFSAVLVSMVVILPAFMFFRTGIGFNTDQSWKVLSPFDIFYGMYFGRIPSMHTDIPYLYSGIPILLLLPLYFCNTKIAHKERSVMAVALGSMLVAIYVKPIYYFLHAFNRPDGFTVRFAFLYIFLIVIMAARAADNLEIGEDKIKLRNVGIYIVGQLLFGVVVFAAHALWGEQDQKEYFPIAAIGNAILLLLWTGYIAIYLKNLRTEFLKKLGVALVMIELGINLFLNQKGIGIEEESDWKSWEAQTKEFLQRRAEMQERDGKGFRAHIGAEPFENMNALYGYEGMTQYVSSSYASVNKLFSRLGDSASTTGCAQTGATDLTDMIFGVRYRGTLELDHEKIEGREAQAFEVYERALPLGFMTSAGILQPITWESNVFENQNRLLSVMCGYRLEPYTPAPVWGYDGQGICFEQTENGYEIRTLSNDSQGYLIYGIPALENNRAYAFFRHYPYTDEPEERFQAENEAKNILRISPADRKYNGVRLNDVYNEAIIEMTRSDDQFLIVVVDNDVADKAYSYVDHFFCYQNDNILDEAYAVLSAGAWSVSDFEQDRIQARVTVDKEKPILFISIPYDKGWTAMVDGRQTQILPVVNDVFMGLYLEPGMHDIELYYEAPGLKEGELLATFGCICWLFLLMFELRKKDGYTFWKRHSGSEKYVDK